MTIPASRIVSIIPGVEGAAGNQFALNGLMLTESWRVPVGTVQAFSDAADVGKFFGSGSQENLDATVYFNGFTGRTQVPSTMFAAQFPANGASAWLLGGAIDTLTISELQAITGSLTIVVDGYTYTDASFNLNSATSFTAAATLIEAALNASLPAGAVSAATGGGIAPETVACTGFINGSVMTLTAAPSFVPVGAAVAGAGVTAGTRVVAQLSGAAGGVGTYAVNQAQSVPSTTLTVTYGLMTLSGTNASGTFSVGQELTGTGVTAGTQLTALGTGVGEAGTYYVYPSQTVSAQTITATGYPLTVTFDATSGGLKVQSGSQGALVSTIDFATGTTAASLFLTAQTGASVSQGATAQTPAAFMDALVEQTQDWANFWTTFDPDDGAGNGPLQKLAFAAWCNAQGNRYCYVAWDNDQTPFTSSSATSSFGNQIKNVYDYSGIYPIWDPNHDSYAAFVAGSAASLNFGATNGRTTFAFRNQSGLVASVTTDAGYTNLLANGYNIYGAFATASQQFLFMYPGLVSGPFLWMDSYQNQIYMSQSFQLDYMELITQVGSIPYNGPGAAQMEAGVRSTIDQMVNYGAIRAGVTLSSLEISEVNSQAGYPIDTTLFAQGWYYQVQPATAAVRQARGSPPVFFWYVDGESVQMITQNSILLL